MFRAAATEPPIVVPGRRVDHDAVIRVAEAGRRHAVGRQADDVARDQVAGRGSVRASCVVAVNENPGIAPGIHDVAGTGHRAADGVAGRQVDRDRIVRVVGMGTMPDASVPI